MILFPKGIPFIKRLFDLILTTILLLIITPFLSLLSFIIWLDVGKPIIFKQTRPGYKAKLFELYKFRTMTNVRNDQGELLPDAERLTKIGRFLRSISLDELPELFNVLRGEMSLVGPRPLLKRYLDRYSKEQFRRHDVLPGMTGWVQVNGRNALTWQDKFRLDVWYVDHWFFFLDLYILLKTPFVVLSRKGISQPGQTTAEEFMGNNDSNGMRNKN